MFYAYLLITVLFILQPLFEATDNVSKINFSDSYVTERHQIKVPDIPTDRTRSYLTFSPKNPPEQAVVWVVFHGSGEHANIPYSESRFNEIAQKNNAIVVYPEGTGDNPSFRSWNAISCCSTAKRNKSNDVEFIDLMLAELTEEYNLTKPHIFLSGNSNGAQFAYRYACESSTNIAGIGVASGAGAEWTSCVIVKDIPTINISEYRTYSTTPPGCSVVTENKTLYASEHATTFVTSFLCNKTQHSYYYLDGGMHGWQNIREVDYFNKNTLYSKPVSHKIWDYFSQNTLGQK